MRTNKPETFLTPVRRVNIWDLDGTVINSFHRVKPCLNENGDLDLHKYKTQACEHELIQQDGLLPLVELMRQQMNEPDTRNYIVTARLMTKSDYYFLRRQGLRGRGTDNIQLFGRDTLARFFSPDDVDAFYHSSDAIYKRGYFNLIQQRHPYAEITVYDDHDGVLDTARSLGFNAVDAKVMNDYLEVGIKLASESIVNEMLDDDNDIDFLIQRVNMAWNNLPDEEKDYYSVKYPYLKRAV